MQLEMYFTTLGGGLWWLSGGCVAAHGGGSQKCRRKDSFLNLFSLLILQGFQ